MLTTWRMRLRNFGSAEFAGAVGVAPRTSRFDEAFEASRSGCLIIHAGRSPILRCSRRSSPERRCECRPDLPAAAAAPYEDRARVRALPGAAHVVTAPAGRSRSKNSRSRHRRAAPRARLGKNLDKHRKLSPTRQTITFIPRHAVAARSPPANSGILAERMPFPGRNHGLLPWRWAALGAVTSNEETVAASVAPSTSIRATLPARLLRWLFRPPVS